MPSQSRFLTVRSATSSRPIERGWGSVTPEPENTPPEQKAEVLTVAHVTPASAVRRTAPAEPVARAVPAQAQARAGLKGSHSTAPTFRWSTFSKPLVAPVHVRPPSVLRNTPATSDAASQSPVVTGDGASAVTNPPPSTRAGSHEYDGATAAPGPAGTATKPVAVQATTSTAAFHRIAHPSRRRPHVHLSRHRGEDFLAAEALPWSRPVKAAAAHRKHYGPRP